MKIIHILPELEEGGVERLIPVYAEGQIRLGHEVTVISFGGRLVPSLPPGTRHIKMPVHKKNPLVGMVCARRIAALAANERIDVVHAHSRVPAWIAYFTKRLYPHICYVYTAHARFSTLNYGMWAIKKADGVICVSESVCLHLANWLPPRNSIRVVYNAPPRPVLPWVGSGDSTRKHLLFIGRVSETKDPFTLVEALAKTNMRNWRMDVFGDGPAMKKLDDRIRGHGLTEKICLHGFSNNVPEIMARSDLFLFPSLDEEGMPLSLVEAVVAGVPTIASDIAATRELMGNSSDKLLPVGDVDAWRVAISRFLDGSDEPFLSPQVKLPSRTEMVEQIVTFYRDIQTRYSQGT